MLASMCVCRAVGCWDPTERDDAHVHGGIEARNPDELIFSRLVHWEQPPPERQRQPFWLVFQAPCEPVHNNQYFNNRAAREAVQQKSAQHRMQLREGRPLPFGRVVLLAELGLTGKPEEPEHKDCDDAVDAERLAEGPATQAKRYSMQQTTKARRPPQARNLGLRLPSISGHLPSAAIVQGEAAQLAPTPGISHSR